MALLIVEWVSSAGLHTLRLAQRPINAITLSLCTGGDRQYLFLFIRDSLSKYG